MSTRLWPPLPQTFSCQEDGPSKLSQADEDRRTRQLLKRELQLSQEAELKWLLEHIQRKPYKFLKDGLTECLERLKPNDSSSTLPLSSRKSEALKGYITKLGTGIVRADIKLRIPSSRAFREYDFYRFSMPQLRGAPVHHVSTLLAIQTNISNALEVLNAIEWSGGPAFTRYISDKLALLDECIRAAHSLLVYGTEARPASAALEEDPTSPEEPAVPAAGSTYKPWWEDSLPADAFDPPLPDEVSLQLSLRRSAIVLTVRVLDFVSDQDVGDALAAAARARAGDDGQQQQQQQPPVAAGSFFKFLLSTPQTILHSLHPHRAHRSAQDLSAAARLHQHQHQHDAPNPAPGHSSSPAKPAHLPLFSPSLATTATTAHSTRSPERATATTTTAAAAASTSTPSSGPKSGLRPRAETQVRGSGPSRRLPSQLGLTVSTPSHPRDHRLLDSGLSSGASLHSPADTASSMVTATARSSPHSHEGASSSLGSAAAHTYARMHTHRRGHSAASAADATLTPISPAAGYPVLEEGAAGHGSGTASATSAALAPPAPHPFFYLGHAYETASSAASSIRSFSSAAAAGGDEQAGGGLLQRQIQSQIQSAVGATDNVAASDSSDMGGTSIAGENGNSLRGDDSIRKKYLPKVRSPGEHNGYRDNAEQKDCPFPRFRGSYVQVREIVVVETFDPKIITLGAKIEHLLSTLITTRQNLSVVSCIPTEIIELD